MDVAIAMRLGGQLVRADEANYYSYMEDGLLCPYCHEPVHLRRGDIRQPYFAHFPNTPSRKLEECELRQSTSGLSTRNLLGDGDKGQRLERFQQHFLEIVICSLSGIHTQNYRSVLNAPVQQITSTIDPNQRREVVSRTIQLVKVEDSVNRRILRETHYDLQKLEGVESSDLNLRIAEEALSYLQVSSSKEILRKLILYLLGIVQNDEFYQLYVSGQAIPYTFRWQSPDYPEQIARTIRYYLLYMLVIIDWEAAFSTPVSYNLLVPSPYNFVQSHSPSASSSLRASSPSSKASNISTDHLDQVSANITTSKDSRGLNGVGTIIGAVGGAIVGGPLGAAVGAMAGAAVGAWIKTLGTRKN